MFFFFFFLMRRRPPGSKRTDTLLPYTTLFRSVAYLSSPWALTSINQGLFWDRDLGARYGNGRVADVLSVDISDFFTPGILYGKAAVDCTPDEIAAECWAQVQAGLNSPGDTQLSRSEERRAGKEVESQCRSRWSPYHSKN